jgi:molybdopterin converting factor small subunit
MSIRIKVTGVLRQRARNQEVVEVKGSTIGECVGAFVSAFPDSRGLVLNDNDSLKVFVIVNKETTPTQDVKRHVSDDDELTLILLITGG